MAALALVAAVAVALVLTRGRGLAVTAVVGSVLVAVVGGRPAWQRLRQPDARAGEDVPTAQPPPEAVPGAYWDHDLQVRWWRRDGHDRLYVTSASGASLGWLDRSTGRLHVLDERNRAAVEQALGATRGVEDKRTA